jgi:hypothetical protein
MPPGQPAGYRLYINPKRPRSLAHHFHDHPLVALAVEFGIEDPLPGSQVEFALGDRNDDLVVDEQRLQMRVAVVFAGLMVFVVVAEGCQRFQSLIDIFDQSALVIVHINTGGNVHG